MSLTVNIYYTGKDGSARAFAQEMMASGLVDQVTDLAGVPTQPQCQGTAAVEPQQPGHLGLAAPDQRGDLRLGEALPCGLSNGMHQLGPGVANRLVASPGHLRQVHHHRITIADAMTAHAASFPRIPHLPHIAAKGRGASCVDRLTVSVPRE